MSDISTDNTAETPVDIARRIAGYIDASPTPYHAAACAQELLAKAGGRVPSSVRETASPGLWYTIDGGSLTAWHINDLHKADSGLHIVCAHTDSPNIRIKPQPDREIYRYRQLSVDTYGGILLNSWLDRDLGLAGRISYRNSQDGVSTKLVHVDEPLLYIPQLAIHLDREVNERGLVLNPQHHMSPIWGVDHMGCNHESPPKKENLDSNALLSCKDSEFIERIADEASVDPDAVVGHDLMAFDLTPARLVGDGKSMFASARIDDLVSCFLAVEALIAVSQDTKTQSHHIPMVCLFDHEEVGNTSYTAASSPRLLHALDMIAAGLDADADDLVTSRAESFVLSVDCGHATHPNYTERHDDNHPVILNGGPMLKVNINQHYATDATTGATWRLVCEQANVPVQYFVNRSDIPCGSTIGPVIATRFGIKAVDIGCPQLAMHSSRELCGVQDIAWLLAGLQQFLLS